MCINQYFLCLLSEFFSRYQTDACYTIYVIYDTGWIFAAVHGGTRRTLCGGALLAGQPSQSELSHRGLLITIINVVGWLFSKEVCLPVNAITFVYV